MPQYPPTSRIVPNEVVTNLTGTRNINNSASMVCKVIVLSPMTAGSFTLNDAGDIPGSNAGNTIYTLPFGNANLNVGGQTIELNIPIAAGLTCSALGAGGVFAVTYSI
jgi:hypothetical protein